MEEQRKIRENVNIRRSNRTKNGKKEWKSQYIEK